MSLLAGQAGNMTEKDQPQPISEMEDRLFRYYRSVSPRPAFSERLESQVEGRARQLATFKTPTASRFWGNILRGAMGWVWAAGGVLLLAAVVVFAVSLLPQRPSALPQTIATQDAAQTIAPTLTATPQSVESQIELSIPGVITYTIQEGDTLLSISEEFGVSVSSLVELNSLAASDVLTPGRVLLIAELYRVAPGDTCASIAFNFGVSVETLVQTNNLNPTCDNLRPDQGLIIPVNQGQPSPTPSPVYVLMDAGDAQHGVPAPADWVRASNPRRDGDKLLVDVCFNLLDDGDWMIRDALLRYNQGEEQVETAYDSVILISLRPFTTDSEGVRHGERCDVLEFPLEGGASLDNAALIVRSLEAFPREGQDCELYLTRVQPLLTARDTGILISCESQSHASGLVSVTAKPDEMTLEQAQALVYQAFQDSITLSGPWEFDLQGMLSESGSLPDLENQQPVLTALRELNRLRSQNYFQGPGWVHVLDREIYAQSGGVLPDGREMPKEYRMDQWYELDEKGSILRTVARMLDMSGNVLQESYLEEGQFTNLTFDEVNQQEVYYLQPFDYGFSDLAENAAKTNKKLTQQPLFFEGEYVGEQFIIEDDETRRESVYDPATGRQLSFSTWKVIPEGLQLISSVVIETMELLPTAPPEILAYFETP